MSARQRLRRSFRVILFAGVIGVTSLANLACGSDKGGVDPTKDPYAARKDAGLKAHCKRRQLQGVVGLKLRPHGPEDIPIALSVCLFAVGNFTSDVRASFRPELDGLDLNDGGAIVCRQSTDTAYECYVRDNGTARIAFEVENRTVVKVKGP